MLRIGLRQFDVEPPPSFLKSYDDLEVHIDEAFKDLTTVEKGRRFASFATKLILFIPEFREFGEARLSEKESNDGGVDIVSEPLENGKRLCVQSKLRIYGKDDIDSVLSKFHDFETKARLGPSQTNLFEESKPIQNVFGIVTLTKAEGIVRRYLASSSATRAYYDELQAQGRFFIIDGPRVFRTLQGSFEKTFGVPSEISVCSMEGWLTHGAVWFGVMSAVDLVELYQQHGDGIFFENIRSFLGPSSGQVSRQQRTVNQEIAETIRSAPANFLERNNGISIKARRVTPLENGCLMLEDASIVNGCQTTMTLVDAKSPINGCAVAAKIIQSDQAWDVAKAANYQNTVDRIELELARYLRPQVVRRASASAGIVVDGTSTGDAMSMLNNFYVSRVQYDEVRTLYIGLMSRSPANIGENNYTELLDYLIMGLAEDPDEQDSLIETLFRVVVATHEANSMLETTIGTRDYMKPFLRVFHEKKPQYRIFFSILALCVLVEDDLERKNDKDKDLGRMRKFFQKTREILDTRRSSFVSTYVHAVTEVAAKAWDTTEDENPIKQDLFNMLKRGFRGHYNALKMKMDVFREFPTS